MAEYGDVKARIDAPVKEVVATAFSLVFGIADDRQITFQSGFADDEDDNVVNARLDRVMRFAERLQALKKLPQLRDERRTMLDEIAQYESDCASFMNNAHPKAQASIDVEIEELQELRKETFDKSYAAFRAAGRQGSYIPKGVDQQRIEAADRAIEAAKAKKVTNDAERDRVEKDYADNIERRRVRIQILDEKIAELELVT